MHDKLKKFLLIAAVFLGCFYLPVGKVRFDNAVFEVLSLLRSYAREHVLLCLVPAFFIAGAIACFVSKASVMKYLGPAANKILAYGVASISGSVLAVCSCTVLPLFAGIWRMGAGLGPACAFLYSGPAINVLAIILTARVLGLEIGIARAVGAVLFSIIIGALMHLIYRKEEVAKATAAMQLPQEEPGRPLWKNAMFFASMVGILVFANWARSGDARAVFLCCPGGLTTYKLEGKIVSQNTQGVVVLDSAGNEHKIDPEVLQSVEQVKKNPAYETIFHNKWFIVAVFGAGFMWMVWRWFNGTERVEWLNATWDFAVQILPLLLAGILVSGLLLGRPGHEGMIPNEWVEWAVGGNSVRANFLSALVGAFMYFATLTEIPILQGLIGSGMGKGPALALLLAGPALSLPSMLVIRSIMGMQKTVVYCSLVVVMATISGMIYGAMF
ncbi:MAG: hypothetical protein FJ263_00730 [Planctomycetes bacterium]|nr:hypothetical protein [Planctomycetota bacterium]